MPEYDYDEYTRRHEEWEAQNGEEGDSNNGSRVHSDLDEADDNGDVVSEEDMDW